MTRAISFTESSIEINPKSDNLMDVEEIREFLSDIGVKSEWEEI